MKQRNVFKMSIFGKLFLIVALFVGGGNAAWAQKSLPYSYGFEEITSSNNGLSTEGWTLTDCYNSNYSTSYLGTSPYVLSSSGYAGSNAFRFYPYANYAAQCLITPELASSTSGIEVSFHYRSSSSSNPIQTFYVGYSTTDALTTSFTWGDEISYKATTWETYSAVFPAGTKYIAIKYTNTTTGAYLYLDGFDFSNNNPYKTPTDFSLSSFTETSVTFSWAAGNSESAWQLAYSTDEDFTPGTDGTTLDISANPYTLSGLTTGTTYYAAIRANYGSGNYSDWSDLVSFTPRAETETTINSTSASTNGYGLFYTSSIKSSLIRSQVIIPSTTLSAINGRQITKLTFYASSEKPDLGSGKYEVYLKEVANTSYSSKTMGDWGTLVYNSATLSISNYEMVVTFDTPFNYNGGNLQIGIKQTEKSNNTPYMSWYCVKGISQSNRQSTDDGEATYYAYNPKITITSTPVTTAPVQIDGNGYTTFASTYPLDLTTANLPSCLKAYKAAVNGEKVKFTEINQTVPANTGMLLEGTAGETYFIPVAESGTAPDGNEFLVNSTGGTFAAETGFTYFGLLKNSDPLTFGVFDPASVAIPTNKAYLKVADVEDARVLSCSFSDGDIQGIEDNVTEHDNQLSGSTIFNLAGQKVENPTKGLYIINGRKQVIK